MCEPATLTAIGAWAAANAGTIAAVSAVASTGASLYGQHQQMKQQERYNDVQYANTMTAYRENHAQANLARAQETAGAAQKIQQNNQAGIAARATARTAAGESGISGLSVDALLSELQGNQVNYNASVTENMRGNIDNIEMQRRNARTSAASQINQLKTPQAPDYLGAALRIGQQYHSYKNPLVG